MILLLISDIHANLTALNAVIAEAEAVYGTDFKVAHLGDAVDYGMRPNETLARMVDAFGDRMVANLAGNHERAILGEGLDRFSSLRGQEASRYTRSILEPKWLNYIAAEMANGPLATNLFGFRVLFVHGDLSDPFWGSMKPSEMDKAAYRDFDYVFSGHTHIRLLREVFFTDTSDNARAGKKKTTFINPGSVGQPRNHNARSQFAAIDLERGEIHFHAVEYDIQKELIQYRGEVDSYYAHRLQVGT